MKRSAGLLVASLVAAVFIPYPVLADNESDQGMKLYNSGDYRNAAMHFANSLKANPINPQAVFYAALCCRKMGNENAAQNGFQTVVQIFPTSPEAALAKKEIEHPGSSSAASSTPTPRQSTTWTATRTTTNASSGRTAASTGRSATATSGATPAANIPIPSSDAPFVVEHRKNTNTPNARTGVAAALRRIPAPLKEAVFGGGCRVVITPTVLEYRPELVSERPRGYSHGGGYDNCPALYNNGKNEILVAEQWGYKNGPSRPGRTVDYEEALGHEFGHAFDAFIGKAMQGGHYRHFYNLTETDWFMRTYKAEAEKLTNQQRRDVEYFTQNGTSGASELFAELFASIYSGSPNREQAKLASFFPQTRAKIFMLGNLRNFSQEGIHAAIPDMAEKGVASGDE